MTTIRTLMQAVTMTMTMTMTLAVAGAAIAQESAEGSKLRVLKPIRVDSASSYVVLHQGVVYPQYASELQERWIVTRQGPGKYWVRDACILFFREVAPRTRTLLPGAALELAQDVTARRWPGSGTSTSVLSFAPASVASGLLCIAEGMVGVTFDSKGSAVTFQRLEQYADRGAVSFESFRRNVGDHLELEEDPGEFIR